MAHRITLTIALGLLSIAASASAQETSRTLAELRGALASYDLGPEGTTRTIEALGLVARDARGPERSEARFLRAIATTDLALIARRRGDDELLARIARAYGTTPDELDGALRSELASLRREPFAAVARDALAALDPDGVRAAPPPRHDRLRSQAVYFTRVLEELVRTSDPVRALAEHASDPCAGERACPSPYDHFGPRGRRAIAAMTALHRLLASVEETARLGDPFSAALAREVMVDAVVLRSITIAPADWAIGVGAVSGSPDRAPVRADAVLVVGPGRVRAGWIPEVIWDTSGRPVAMADGPLLASPEESAIALEEEVESFVRRIPELEAYVSQRIRGAARVALMIEPGVDAHVLWRVLVSLEGAGVRPRVLAVASHDGTARGVAFEAVHEDVSSVGVFVRLGGFSAWQPSGRVSLPRVRTDSGRWQFDFDGLDAATSERARHPVTLRFMGTVAADLVLRVALQLGGGIRPLRLIVPYATQREDES